MKTFTILKESIPLSMARLTNQIVFVCGFLTNILPALLPSSNDTTESDSSTGQGQGPPIVQGQDGQQHRSTKSGWVCYKCKYYNFSSQTSCKRCSKNRETEEEVPAQRGRKRRADHHPYKSSGNTFHMNIQSWARVQVTMHIR